MRQLHPRYRADVDVAAVYADDARPAPADRPWVLCNMVTSVDGATALEGVSGGLGTPADRAAFHAIRATADVILVGAATVRAEGYGPARLGEDERERRLAAGRAAAPRMAVVSATLDLDFSSRLFTDSDEKPILLTSTSVPAGRRAAAGNRVRVITAGDHRVDLAEALGKLRELGANTVLCEGGPTLNAQLVAADLIDEVCVTVSPLLVGGAARRIAQGPNPAVATAMRLDRVLEADGTLLLRYVRR